MKKIAPCKNCTLETKKIGCHATCEHYISWVRDREEIKKRMEVDKKSHAIWDQKTKNRFERIIPCNGKRRGRLG